MLILLIAYYASRIAKYENTCKDCRLDEITVIYIVTVPYYFRSVNDFYLFSF